MNKTQYDPTPDTITVSCLCMEVGGHAFIIRYLPHEYPRAIRAALQWAGDERLPEFGSKALESAARSIYAEAQLDGLLVRLSDERIEAAESASQARPSWLVRILNWWIGG